MVVTINTLKLLDFITPPDHWRRETGKMSSAIARFLYNGLSPSSRKVYKLAQISYENFCARSGFTAWPAQQFQVGEWMAIRAIGSIDEPAVRVDTIRKNKAYLRAVHVDRNLSTAAFDDNAWFTRILDGITRLQIAELLPQGLP